MTRPDAKMDTLPLLVIEDETSVQAFLRAALERHGYKLTMAPSGAEGLRLLKQHHYRAVISDMRTPGGVNGADVHKWVMGNRPELIGKILFITGDIVNEETMQILQSTGAPCIEKPFRVQELISAVRELLEESSNG